MDGTLNVPNDPGNRHYQEVQEWLMTNTADPIPVIIPTTEQQVVIDLNAAGVTARTIEAAIYLDHRGNSAPITAIDASIDAVVISSGLTLAVVTNLL